MRRILVIAVLAVIALVTAVPTAGAAPNRTKNVNGVLNGAGEFISDRACPLIVDESHGTYRAKHLGRGTYHFKICVSTNTTGFLHAVGTFDLLTRAGDELHGAIDTPLPSGLQGVPVTITGGTGRFAGATGNLGLDIVMFN